MKTFSFKDLYQFLKETEVSHRNEVILYRGQSNDMPLLPVIARKNPTIDTALVERRMLGELKRRSTLLSGLDISNTWDLLVCAQHFGMATRLLDWTSNPLAALWFACRNEDVQSDSFVYLLVLDDRLQLDAEKESDPFDIKLTRVFKPKLNNNRIVAQSGWFTAHRYSISDKRFVALENNKDIGREILRVQIPGAMKLNLLDRLSSLGISHQSMFPDIEGVCKHLNWLHT